jgi:hypothetical protein
VVAYEVSFPTENSQEGQMDKRKVIMAYRKGFITIQECAQILGIDSMQIMSFVNDPSQEMILGTAKIQSING